MNPAPTDNEVSLARKLAETFHLNVDERQQLPNGEVRLSAIVVAVDASLKEIPFFPPRFRPGEGFTGIVLERRDDGSIWMHEQHEVGVGRYSDVLSQRARSLADAVQRYLVPLGGTSIDGVHINWHA